MADIADRRCATRPGLFLTGRGLCPILSAAQAHGNTDAGERDGAQESERRKNESDKTDTARWHIRTYKKKHAAECSGILRHVIHPAD